MSLRLEQPDDAAFLYALFRSHAVATLAPANQPAPVIEQLAGLQHRSQTASYRASFPDARFLIVEQGGVPIARLVETDEPGGVYVVDIAVAPERQRSGVAAALLRDLQARQAQPGLGVRAQVAMLNLASRVLFRRLGFNETVSAAGGGFEVLWTAPLTTSP